MKIPVKKIKIPRGRLREADTMQVERLKDSIREIGLLHPITLDERFNLLAGLHRLTAVRELGLTSIEVMIKNTAKLKRELIQIEENLVRYDLNQLQRSEQLARRKDIYLLLYPETKRGGYGRGRAKENGADAFSLVASTQTGKALRTVQEDLQIASIDERVKEVIRGMPIANQKKDLLKLSRLEPAEQLSVVKQLVPGKVDRFEYALSVARSKRKRKLERTPASVELITGDSFRLVAKLKKETVNLIVTSPPYNVGKEYETKTSIRQFLKPYHDLAQHLYRILHPAGSLCWQVGRAGTLPLDIPFYEIFTKAGFVLQNRIVWIFHHGMGTSKRFSNRYECLLWFTKSAKFHFNLDPIRAPQKYPQRKYYDGPSKGLISSHPLGGNPSDVWQIAHVQNIHPEKLEHPAQFPVELIERCVLSMTEPGNTVLDCFSGVGSSGVAAIRHGRKYIGIEKSRRYHAIASKRLAAKNPI